MEVKSDEVVYQFGWFGVFALFVSYGHVFYTEYTTVLITLMQNKTANLPQSTPIMDHTDKKNNIHKCDMLYKRIFF